MVMISCMPFFQYSLGNTAPYHITQPTTDNDVQIVSPTATMANLTCSLNVNIPTSMIIIWNRNGSFVATTTITDDNGVGSGTSTAYSHVADKTTKLVIDNLKPSDAGDYQCVFNDSTGSGWVLTRNIRLFITSMFLWHKIIFVCNFSSSLFIALATCSYKQ